MRPLEAFALTSVGQEAGGCPHEDQAPTGALVGTSGTVSGVPETRHHSAILTGDLLTCVPGRAVALAHTLGLALDWSPSLPWFTVWPWTSPLSGLVSPSAKRGRQGSRHFHKGRLSQVEP